MNQRLLGSGLYFFVELYTHDYPTPQQYLSDVALTATSYNQALSLITKQRLLSPVYYAIAGKDTTDNKLKGCLLERGKLGVDQEYCVGYNESDPNGKGSDSLWQVVITNWDRFTAEPEDDYRRAPMEEKLGVIGQGGMDVGVMWGLMMEDPTFVVKHASGTVATNVYVMGGGGLVEDRLMKFNLGEGV